MDRESYARVRELFMEAQDLPEESRSAFLDEACGDNQDVRTEVDSLLGHTSDDPFIENRDTDPLGIVGTVVDGRYRVDAFVDEGGFGFVYRAQHEFWNKPVAIKFFKAPLDGVDEPELVREAFVKEGALLNDLSRRTTSIVQSYDVGLWDSPRGGAHLFTVLEWLEGQTLQALMDTERQDGSEWGWRLDRVMTTLAPIAEALAVAHEAHIAHRDVKPSNIFLLEATDGLKSTTKLLDFGIAKVSRASIGFETTTKGVSAFSLAYAAPEQVGCTAGTTGPWTDVYALAMVCTDLLCGRHPVGKGAVGRLVQAAANTRERPTPGHCGVSVSPAVEAVFAKALAVKPTDRHPNARAFWKALEAASGCRPQTTAQCPTGAEGKSGATEKRGGAAGGATTNWQRLLVPAAVLLGAAGFWGVRHLGDDHEGNDSARAAAALRPGLERKTEIDPGRLTSFAALPATTPALHEPAAERASLGRRLFSEPLLSSRSLGGPRACASCHDLANYGVSPRRSEVGHASQAAPRNALSVYNRQHSFALMWDGSSRTLQQQVAQHLSTPLDPRLDAKDVARRLENVGDYEEAFARAFPSAANDRNASAITLDNAATALAAFMGRLATPGARWDLFLAGDSSALTEQERAGFNAFVDVGCVSCHFGPHLGDSMFQKLGLVRAYPNSRDRGRYEVTRADADWMVFRVPSLRDVEKTAPYFHNGSIATLDEAVRLMAHHQLGRELSNAQIEDIVAWLGTLTGVIPKELATAVSPDAG